MAGRPSVPPALAGAWLAGGAGTRAGRPAATLADRWRREHAAPIVHRFADIDGDEVMLLAEFPDRVSAADASATATLAGSDGRVAGFVHGRSNLPGGNGRFEDTPYLFVVRVFAPTEWVEPLREWLHGEHFDLQLSTPGLLWARGYEAMEPPFHFLNIWGLERPDVPDSKEYVDIRDTPWFAKVAPAFTASDVRRTVYRRVAQEEG